VHVAHNELIIALSMLPNYRKKVGGMGRVGIGLAIF